MKLTKYSLLKKFKLKYLILFLVLLYAPFFIFAKSVYYQSVDIERTERLRLKTLSLGSDAYTLNMRLTSMRRDIDRLVSNPAIGRSLRVYHNRDAITRKSLVKYIDDKKKLILQGGLVEEMIFVTPEKDIVTASQYFKDVVDTIDLSFTYDYEMVDFKRYDGYMNTKLFFLKSIKANEGDQLQSLLIFVLDKKKLIATMASAFNDAVGFIDDKQGDIAFSQKLKDEFKAAIKFPTPKGNTELLGKVILTEKIDAFNWTVYSIIDSSSLVVETTSTFETHSTILFLFALVSSVAITLIFLISVDYRTGKEIAEHKFQLSETTNNQLRLYKHDLMNHLQVIQGLLEMERYERAIAYIQRIGHEGAALRSRHHIGIPELEAAIFSQLTDCEAYAIQVELDCITLDESFPYDVYALSKIMTNLIKNGIEALKTYDKDRLMRIEIKKVATNFLFIITNSGPIIDEEKRDRIFQYGYSEKGDHRGYGLFIARTAIEKLGGRLKLEMDLSGNHFIVELPIDKKL